MEIFLFILSALLIIVGSIGAVVPALPGPPLGYVGLLLLQLTDKVQFSTSFLVVWGIVVLAVTILDYLLPIWTTKKVGGSKAGINGSIIGMVVGIIFTPIGMILGTLLGAIIGEIIGGASGDKALKSGLATFVGTMLSIGIKLIVCVSLLMYYIIELF
ncbi:MAG: DUF456 domain-containing protein [Paludibacteraceae bacterium]|nr:DUF456 domain-containing protein [Paludibacteraceae bacterium]